MTEGGAENSVGIDAMSNSLSLPAKTSRCRRPSFRELHSVPGETNSSVGNRILITKLECDTCSSTFWLAADQKVLTCEVAKSCERNEEKSNLKQTASLRASRTYRTVATEFAAAEEKSTSLLNDESLKIDALVLSLLTFTQPRLLSPAQTRALETRTRHVVALETAYSIEFTTSRIGSSNSQPR